MANPTKVIIAASGSSTRWGNYLGVPKHLISINGEKLIHRTIRLVKEAGFTDIILMANDPDYGAYGINITMPKDETIFSGTALGQSYQFWDKSDVLIILGDIYFSDECIIQLTTLPESQITFIGRLKDDPNTGHGGELFAIYVPSNQHENIIKAIEIVKEIKARERQAIGGIVGYLGRHSGWEIYKQLNGFDTDKHEPEKYIPNFIEITDKTDDFDYPEDLQRWAKAYNMKIDNAPN